MNNSYKETYVISLVYEHVFSMLYHDGGSIDTRLRLLRTLDTPLLCRSPFTTDRESAGHRQAEVGGAEPVSELCSCRDGG